ncbi:MAG: IMP cyclohydrolase [Clostridia bacterium]|nr:IMP cyclohydrolase [Clostridia bacterium]
MKVNTIAKELNSLAYHGRGIIIGKSADGRKAVTAYFIMGRSVNSRNRVFVAEGDAMRTKAFDESKMVDPHLIIYYPVRVLGNKTIVTNGDQTDTIYDLMDKQMTFEQALRTREFEDDSPNFTPRISGIIHREDGDMNFAMSILKSAEGDDSSCERFTYAYTNPICGRAKFIHTYSCDGNPLPSFEGEPKTLELPNVSIDELTDLIWTNLNEDNKVSLFVRYIDLASGESETRIINKNA